MTSTTEVEAHGGNRHDARVGTDLVEVFERVDEPVQNLVRSLVSELRTYYDEVDESFTESLLLSATQETDPEGYFTMRKRLFTLWIAGSPVAFTVATVKRGGSVKIGPTAVAEQWRRQRLASHLRDLVEESLFAEGARKLYMTVSARNHAALEFNLGRGFQVEGVLRGQYRPDAAELVLGKFPRLTHPDRVVPPSTGRAVGAGAVALVDAPSVDLVRSYLEPRMSDLYDGVDPSFFDAVVLACRSHRQTYARKGKRVFVVTDGDTVSGLAVYVPKRGGSSKLSPFFAESAEAATHLHERVLEYAIVDKRRRLYVHVPVAMPFLVTVLHRLGYSVEAVLREPYRHGVDVVSLGRELWR